MKFSINIDGKNLERRKRNRSRTHPLPHPVINCKPNTKRVMIIVIIIFHIFFFLIIPSLLSFPLAAIALSFASAVAK